MAGLLSLALVFASAMSAAPASDAAASDASTAAPGSDAATPSGAQPSGAAPAGSATTTGTPAFASSNAAKRRERMAKFGREGQPLARRFMIGIGGVLMQAAPLRVRAVYLDPRDVGRSVALGGLGVFARFRPRPIVGLDLDVRSGSVRYRRSDADVSVSQDQVIAELGGLLYRGRGDIAQFALS
ncbi:MAG TPA: hypothetical protein VG755_09775 [Nannocystaceae bacterium]|nr:hypothetical protein [Nannocystaceae bacterium]